ncbi:hypothetical protein HDF16_002814 [Granulicella aggregans]|nr:hypothetical protein [Granulicella aggregans]
MEPANQAVGNVRNNGPEMLIGEPLVNTVSRP